MRKETLELLIKTTVLANKARYKRDIGTAVLGAIVASMIVTMRAILKKGDK